MYLTCLNNSFFKKNDQVSSIVRLMMQFPFDLLQVNLSSPGAFVHSCHMAMFPNCRVTGQKCPSFRPMRLLLSHFTLGNVHVTTPTKTCHKMYENWNSDDQYFYPQCWSSNCMILQLTMDHLFRNKISIEIWMKIWADYAVF